MTAEPRLSEHGLAVYVLEDNAHELFVPSLFRRLATEAGKSNVPALSNATRAG